MPNHPQSAVYLPLRCCRKLGARPDAWCGAIATHLMPGTPLFPEGFYCADHADALCVPLAGARLVRRVRVMACLDVAGVSFVPGQAQTEAVDRLERLCRAAGVAFNLVNVSSAVVENPPEPAPRGAVASGGVG